MQCLFCGEKLMLGNEFYSQNKKHYVKHGIHPRSKLLSYYLKLVNTEPVYSILSCTDCGVLNSKFYTFQSYLEHRLKKHIKVQTGNGFTVKDTFGTIESRIIKIKFPEWDENRVNLLEAVNILDKKFRSTINDSLLNPEETISIVVEVDVLYQRNLAGVEEVSLPEKRVSQAVIEKVKFVNSAIIKALNDVYNRLAYTHLTGSGWTFKEILSGSLRIVLGDKLNSDTLVKLFS